jgi:hypothetical protein
MAIVRDFIKVLFLFASVVMLVHIVQNGAYGEEHVHVGDVGQFYATWMRPSNVCSDEVQGRYVPAYCGHRKSSCCSNQDCHNTQVKKIDGRWQFWDYWSFATSPRWRDVPDNIMEHNQPDPRESPDGQNHVCASPGNVFCAVFGSGQ